MIVLAGVVGAIVSLAVGRPTDAGGVAASALADPTATAGRDPVIGSTSDPS